MKITNRTQYDTGALRSIICGVHARLAQPEGKLHSWKYLRVTIVYSRRARYISGRASIGGSRMLLRVPREQDANGTQWFAWLVEHEMLHNYGYRHKQMERGWPTIERLAERYGWASDLAGALLPLAAPKIPKPKPDVQTIRYERVLAGLKRWATKLKRAQTAIKTLNAKRRYYEAALTAAGKLPRKD